MFPTEIQVVTGAFGYSGQYITRRLLDAGVKVRTLTNSPRRIAEWENRVEVHPFHFDDPAKLAESLTGAKVLYNTYWVRFNHKAFNHSSAVENTLKLFEAAKAAGIERIVHTSITNPSEDSPLEYFSGKAVLEKALISSGLSYAILRPTVLFGVEDILINNIAWILRKFPAFGIFGDGKYRLQPIFIDDFAALAVEQGKSQDNRIINAIGPEVFTYKELVETISEIVLGKKRPMVSIPDGFGLAVGKVIGCLTGDVVITREEIQGLKSNLLYVDDQPAGTTALSGWLREHRDTVGKQYAGELARRKG